MSETRRLSYYQNKNVFAMANGVSNVDQVGVDWLVVGGGRNRCLAGVCEKSEHASRTWLARSNPSAPCLPCLGKAAMDQR